MKALIYAGTQAGGFKGCARTCGPGGRGEGRCQVLWCVRFRHRDLSGDPSPRQGSFGVWPRVFGRGGRGREKFKKGDRVVAYPLLSCGHCRACRTGSAHVCNTLGLIGIDVDGGMCEELYVDEDVLFKVPDGVSDRAAVVTEPLAVILRAVHQAEFKARDVAVVIGAGPIGMLTGIVLKNIGAAKVFISDVAEKRLAIAEELGPHPGECGQGEPERGSKGRHRR